MMRLTRWLAGSVAALAAGFALASVDRAQAATPGSPGAAAAIKDAVGEPAVQVRFGHGGFGHFHGGFGRFHGFGHRAFFRPRFAYAPIYYAPIYRCPLV